MKTSLLLLVLLLCPVLHAQQEPYACAPSTDKDQKIDTCYVGSIDVHFPAEHEGVVLVPITVGKRATVQAILDTSEPAVLINDDPTKEELANSVQVTFHTAGGDIQAIGASIRVCLVVNKTLDIQVCQYVQTIFSKAFTAPVLGISFIGSFERTEINRLEESVTFEGPGTDDPVFVVIKGKDYLLKWPGYLHSDFQ